MTTSPADIDAVNIDDLADDDGLVAWLRQKHAQINAVRAIEVLTAIFAVFIGIFFWLFWFVVLWRGINFSQEAADWHFPKNWHHLISWLVYVGVSGFTVAFDVFVYRKLVRKAS